MKKAFLGLATAAMMMGHNNPPAPIPTAYHVEAPAKRERAAHKDRRDRKRRKPTKGWRKLFRRYDRVYTVSRFGRKTERYGSELRPGKLFKGHRP